MLLVIYLVLRRPGARDVSDVSPVGRHEASIRPCVVVGGEAASGDHLKGCGINLDATTRDRMMRA